MSSTRPASRVVVLGARGMLGSDLCEVLEKDREVIALGHDEADITDRPALVGLLSELRPAWVLNSAAFTDVDGAESREDEAIAVNRDGAANVAAAAAETGAGLVHFSTDFVFDGKKGSPYREDDEPSPLGIYGRSKLEGELAVRKIHPRGLVVRTSWTFGSGRTNFVEKILDLAERERRFKDDIRRQMRERDLHGGEGIPSELKVVSDQVGSPTYTRDLAGKVREMIDAALKGGIYHVTNSGSCARTEQAGKILQLAGLQAVKIVPVESSFFHAPATRPANSVLENAALQAAGVPLLRPWEEALADYIAERA